MELSSFIIEPVTTGGKKEKKCPFGHFLYINTSKCNQDIQDLFCLKEMNMIFFTGLSDRGAELLDSPVIIISL